MVPLPDHAIAIKCAYLQQIWLSDTTCSAFMYRCKGLYNLSVEAVQGSGCL